MNNYFCRIPSEITNFTLNYTRCLLIKSNAVIQPTTFNTDILLYLMELKILREIEYL